MAPVFKAQQDSQVGLGISYDSNHQFRRFPRRGEWEAAFTPWGYRFISSSFDKPASCSFSLKSTSVRVVFLF